MELPATTNPIKLDSAPHPPKPPDRFRADLRTWHYSIRAEEAYADWARRGIVVREGKGNKDRVTVLPGNLIAVLQTHWTRRVRCTRRICGRAWGGFICRMRSRSNIRRPVAPGLGQWVFPSLLRSVDPRPDVRTGQTMERRFHDPS